MAIFNSYVKLPEGRYGLHMKCGLNISSIIF